MPKIGVFCSSCLLSVNVVLTENIALGASGQVTKPGNGTWEGFLGHTLSASDCFSCQGLPRSPWQKQTSAVVGVWFLFVPQLDAELHAQSHLCREKDELAQKA